MKLDFFFLRSVLGLSLLAGGLSSCRLFQNGKLSASQWEIESEVPASLNNGQASAPPSGALAGNTVHSDLSGGSALSAADGGMLDLPMHESGTMMDIPKPDLTMDGMAYQSPPEMLSIPASEGDAQDLPGNSGSYPGTGQSGPPSSLTTLLPAPPPAVTEEELAMAAPEALTAEAASAVASELALSNPASGGSGRFVSGNPNEESHRNPIQKTGSDRPAGAARGNTLSTPSADLAAASIPLLYGKLDWIPFPTPAPMAAPLAPLAAAGP